MRVDKPFKYETYKELADYCIKNDMHIEDKGEYWESIPNVEVVIPLDEIKATKIAELKLARDTEELSPISCNNYLWDFDEKAQMRINGAITVLDDNTITWTTADNQEVVVNADDLKEIIGASAVRSNTLHIKYRELKAQVENAESVEEVNAVVW